MKIVLSPTLILLTFALGAGCIPVQPVSDTTATSPQENPFAADGYLETPANLGDKGYSVKKIADKVYFFSTGVYNNIFIVTEEGVIATDPIRGKGALLEQAIREITHQPIKFLIYSHPHLDHIGDAHLFVKGAQIIAHQETKKLLQRYKDPNRPIPEIAFQKNYSLRLGGVQVNLIYPGEGHDKGNIMIHLPESKVLMFVDVATPKAVPFKNFVTTDIFSQVRGLERALKLDFDIYVAGHLHRPGKREEMQEVLNYYYDSKKANKAALKAVPFSDVRAKSKTRDVERLFGEYYQAVSLECTRILRKKWKSRLMGFEAFAPGHCDVWTGFHRTHKAP
jgi:glyoxylase-like metal-dependent hydrolase (beta-lactamase superfamily II)